MDKCVSNEARQHACPAHPFSDVETSFPRIDPGRDER